MAKWYALRCLPFSLSTQRGKENFLNFPFFFMSSEQSLILQTWVSAHLASSLLFLPLFFGIFCGGIIQSPTFTTTSNKAASAFIFPSTYSGSLSYQLVEDYFSLIWLPEIRFIFFTIWTATRMEVSRTSRSFISSLKTKINVTPKINKLSH